MAPNQFVGEWRLTLPGSIFRDLFAHLFPGDGDEHGAVILAATAQSDRGLRLIARELHIAVDGKDYVPGKRGYRMLRAEYIQQRILRARDEGFAYLAVHNHGGSTSVAFSQDDIASHERGYPALLDIGRGVPVGALVFAKAAAAGDLWLPDRKRAALTQVTVVGRQRRVLSPGPVRHLGADARYDRQARLFGDAGQAIFRSMRVGIIGLGGAGSILAELLARLGVGEFVLVDSDHVELSNLPRLIGASLEDAAPETRTWRRKRSSSKAAVAVRNIKRANPIAKIVAFERDFTEAEVAAKFTDCDYLFLAADTMSARLVFNAIVHQYGIPGVQVGAKVPVDVETGTVGEVFCVSRTLFPGDGCLWCSGLISATRLRNEATSRKTREGYAYVEEPEVVAPSVVTLNAIACAHAADEFLFYVTGLKSEKAEGGWFRWNSRRGQVGRDFPSPDPECLECSPNNASRLSRGDQRPLPVRPRQ